MESWFLYNLHDSEFRNTSVGKSVHYHTYKRKIMYIRNFRYIALCNIDIDKMFTWKESLPNHFF